MPRLEIPMLMQTKWPNTNIGKFLSWIESNELSIVIVKTKISFDSYFVAGWMKWVFMCIFTAIDYGTAKSSTCYVYQRSI